jgi:hypothetical protein
MHFNYSSEKGLKGTHCPRRMGKFNSLYQDRISNGRAESGGSLKPVFFLLHHVEMRCTVTFLNKR